MAQNAKDQNEAVGSSEPEARLQDGKRWKGEAVDPRGPASESAEAAASRAEGNAPVSAKDVIGDADGARARQGLEIPGADGGKAPSNRASEDDRADSEDERENAEEKRRAAAEEHAQSPSRRAPHGRL